MPLRAPGPTVVVVAWCAWIGLAGNAHAAPSPPAVRDAAFAACAPQPGAPWTYDQLMCLRRAAAEHDARREVQARLRSMGGGERDRPWPTLVLAHVAVDEGRRDEAIRLYERAADGFAGSREAEGEVIARQNAAAQCRLLGRIEDSAAHVRRAVAAAEASGLPLVVVRAAVTEASHAMATGGDIGRAQRALARADRLSSRDTPLNLRRTVLFNLATASLYLGRLDVAIDALERHRALMAEDGSTQNAATVSFNLLTARLARAEGRLRSVERPALVAEAEAVLAEGERLLEPVVVARAHQVIGDLLQADDPGRAATHLRACLDTAVSSQSPRIRATCLWRLSRLEAERDTRAAAAHARDALALLQPGQDDLLLSDAWPARLAVLWKTLPEREAVAESVQVLDAIERLRAAEGGESGRVDVLSGFARQFQWLVGRLLQSAAPRLAEAFEAGERLRARALLEALAQAGVREGTLGSQAAPVSLLTEQIVRTQRRLLTAPAESDARRLLLEELRLLELERADRTAPVPALSAQALRLPSLAEVQRALAADEAMIWYSLAPWADVYGQFGGGSWALVITRAHAAAYPIARDVDLEAQAAAFTGLLRERAASPGTWQPAARSIGRTLLGDAVRTMPSSVTRLVIVSDGPLHRLPFEALELPDGGIAGERFGVSVVPSAALWLRQRHMATARSARTALVLADPVVHPVRDQGVAVLPPLPYARDEARDIARLLHLSPGQVLEGAAASERVLKQTALSSVGVLHVAAHARADALVPDRAAIYLSPGHDDEDGWLQPAEIASLDLAGRLVVLSACDAAEGTLGAGEGPLSLARAFFAAGASGVVATRWPLRDDDAAFLMSRFYEALAQGRSVDAGLRQARAAAREANLPAAAWAGLVSLGDGARVPVEARAPQPRRSRVGWTVAVVIVILAAARRRRRRTSR